MYEKKTRTIKKQLTISLSLSQISHIPLGLALANDTHYFLVNSVVNVEFNPFTELNEKQSRHTLGFLVQFLEI